LNLTGGKRKTSLLEDHEKEPGPVCNTLLIATLRRLAKLPGSSLAGREEASANEAKYRKLSKEVRHQLVMLPW